MQPAPIAPPPPFMFFTSRAKQGWPPISIAAPGVPYAVYATLSHKESSIPRPPQIKQIVLETKTGRSDFTG